MEELFWSQKYRPKTVEECILPTALSNTFAQFVETGSVPNLILAGKGGVGKTTVAMALCDQLGYDYILLNGSNEGRLLDTFRTTIANFASSMSMMADRKCVILDEFEAAPEAVQLLMRQFMELHSKNCSFIMTCNYKNRIIEPLHSRSTVIDFKINQGDLPQLSARFFKRALTILTENGIDYDKAAVAALVKRYAPDWRRTLNELQRYSAGGKIDEGILALIDRSSATEVIEKMKQKDFKSIHEWVFSQVSLDMAQFGRELAEGLRAVSKPATIPGIYITVADYQHKHTVAIDPQINLLAMIAQLMFEIEFA